MSIYHRTSELNFYFVTLSIRTGQSNADPVIISLKIKSELV